MRRYDKEIKDRGIIDEILNLSRICRLGMVDGDMAYIVPVNYGYYNNAIYIHSAPNGRKMEIIKRNNKVSFEIEFSEEVIKNEELACKWTAKYRSVMGWGTIEIITDRYLKKQGMDAIMKKYGATQDLNYDAASLSRMVILKLNITSVTGKQSGLWDNKS
jgi:nitroimidazol reductase NimA-like FMN-containing flavoprotein (pyridoxamine 5'-phosphate oxidase superfamily)